MATRARLIGATLDLLLSKGYAATTMVDIAAHADLTRGALAHHFSGKDEMVIEAFDHHLTLVTKDIDTYARLVREGTLGLDDFVNRAWIIFSGPFFLLTLEEITAARHNAYLRSRMRRRTRSFHEALDAIWRRLFEGIGFKDHEVEDMLNATLCFLRGMGVQSVLRDDPVYFDRLLRFWKAVLKEQIESVTRSAASPRHQPARGL